MRHVTTLDTLGPGDPGRPVCLTVGVFDGLHVGHRALLARTVARSREAGALAALLTFERHPLAFLAPPYEPPRLITGARRRELLGGLGLDLMIEVAFDRTFAQIPAEEFVRSLLVGRLRVIEVACGATHRFGHKGAGDPALLRRLGAELGFDVWTPPMERQANADVSSTGIRNWLLEGEVGRAAAALARPYELAGVVVAGDRRGRTIGYPTANLEPAEGLLVPGRGVYACRAEIDGAAHAAGAMVNIGTRPTFDGARQVVEAHLLDFHGDLYGRALSLHFVRRLREERKFTGLEALRAQLAADAVAAREALAR